MASEVDVALSCLPDERSVEAVYLGTGNVLQGARAGTRIIELSTISPEASRQLHLAARQFDVSVLDVGVSGSTPTAERQVFESAGLIFAVIVIVYSPMASGLLSGAMNRERIAALPEDDWRKRSANFRGILPAARGRCPGE